MKPPSTKRSHQVLFLVHVEETFRTWFPENYEARIHRFCRTHPFHRILLLQSEESNQEALPCLRCFLPEIWVWNWGYAPDQFSEEEQAYVIPSSRRHFTWVPPEIRDAESWRNRRITLAGGHRGECLSDWQDVLQHQQIPYTLASSLLF